MSTTRISLEQRRALECIVNGDGPGEFWAAHDGNDALAWYRSERTLDSLRRRGLVDDHGQITNAGRVALAINPTPVRAPKGRHRAP